MEPPTFEELEKAIKKLKNNKAQQKSRTLQAR